jgi:hypothetical protein
MAFFVARVAWLDRFAGSEDSAGRALLSPGEARDTTWVHLSCELYEAGLSAATG